MEASLTGHPCWYELGTTDLVAAGTFYGGVMDWTVTGSRVTEVPYTVAMADGLAAAGLMLTTNQVGTPPPSWVVYFAADDCTATAKAIPRAGGELLRPPSEAPGIGEFAIACDPTGAVFGVICREGDAAGAVQRARPNWHELMSRDPDGALDFYGEVFGWTEGPAHEMPHVGTARTLQSGDDPIGCVMRIGEDAPSSVWLPYFGVPDLPECLRRIGLTGGSVMHGPADNPDGRQIAVATDPQGAWFALVGEAATDRPDPRALPVRSG